MTGPTFTLDEDSIASDAAATAARTPEALPGYTGPENEGAAAAAEYIAPEAGAHAIPQSGGPLDAFGVAWNPEIHAKGRDGNGVRTADGSWRKKRRSRVGGDTPKPTSNVATIPALAPGQLPPLTPEEIEGAKAAGALVADCTIMSCTAFGGEDWQAQTHPYDERAAMADAWGKYFIAKRITDLPPSLLVLVATGTYASRRFTDKETFKERATGRVQRIREWFGVRIDRWKQKRAAKETRGKRTAELSIDGTNAKGSDNASQPNV